MNNSGSQHFLEGERRIFDKQYIQLVQTTNESNIDMVMNTTHKITINDEEAGERSCYEYGTSKSMVNL